MKPPAHDFFRYLAATPEAENWGLVVTGAGRFSARPGRPYPPPGHPRDHHFTWERGRVLGAFQVVYLSEGRGEFEARPGDTRAVAAGDALVLRPGMWHRYRPDPETGWTERWVELAGPVVDRLLGAGFPAPAGPVVPVSRRLEFEDRIGAVHGLIGAESPAPVPELAAHALGLLALLDVSRHERQRRSPVGNAIAQARRAMEEVEGREQPMPELARALGVAYSHFRREFRRRTGVSPRQYLLRVRMQRALRLLGSTDETLKQIADRLGFSSPYHLSTAFKKRFGLAPSRWRRSQPARDKG